MSLFEELETAVKSLNKEALRKDSETAKAYAEAESARAIALEAAAISERAEAEITSARTLKWAAEQEARARVAAANAQVAAEREVYARACQYQEQQIKSAIDEKAAELRSQVLGLLVKNLTKIQEKDYQPGKLPPKIRTDLQALIESAQVLAQTDRSLDEVVTSLNTVTASSSTANTNTTELRSQVDALLQNLEQRLAAPEIAESQDDQFDRSSFVNFSKRFSQATTA